MRLLMISASLALATTTASAATKLLPVAQTTANLTLNNGCVYAPDPRAADGTWTFVFANAKASGSCPTAVRLQPSSAVDGTPGYLVGVYR